MYQRINRIIIYLTFILLILSAYFAFTNSWRAKDINFWQIKTCGTNGFYPIITMFCLFIIPMLILLPIQLYIKNKLKKLNKSNGNTNR